MSIRASILATAGVGIVLGFAGAMAGPAAAGRHADAAPAASPAEPLPWEEARLFAEVYERIKREYVDTVDDHELMEKAVRGMVSALDPHSAFLDSEEFEEIRLSTMGSYPGVGIEVVAEDGGVKILRPIEGSPADQAGMHAGDVIVRIDGIEVGADVAAAINRMRGAAGSTIKLTVRRGMSAELLDFSLRRAKVEVRSVARQLLEPGFGYLRISSFSETTYDDVARGISLLKHDSPGGLKGLVLDLRNNPGGVLEAGVAVADAFLEQGLIVSAEGRTPDSQFHMEASAGDLIGGAPLVVLVNGGSASAAEIVAGALKDHGRAELIGHKTYGKGSVQTVMPLSHGGALKLTTSRYFTPSGASIHEKGILPDVLLGGPDELPPELAEAPGSLAQRDPEVRLALSELKSRARAGAKHVALATVP